MPHCLTSSTASGPSSTSQPSARPGLLRPRFGSQTKRRSAANKEAGVELECSYFLPISPDQAIQECERLNLDRFNLKLVPIPAEGGCVVAIIPSGTPRRVARSRWTDAFAGLRQRRAIAQALAEINSAIVPRVAAYR